MEDLRIIHLRVENRALQEAYSRVEERVRELEVERLRAHPISDFLRGRPDDSIELEKEFRKEHLLNALEKASESLERKLLAGLSSIRLDLGVEPVGHPFRRRRGVTPVRLRWLGRGIR